MSIDRFLNIMKIQASLASNGTAVTALGQISAYDAANYYAQVELYAADPSDPASQPTQTPWLPIFSPWVGNGWGFFAPPSVGDIVEVHYQEGSLQNAYIGLRTWYTGVAPLNVPSGELWLVHNSGSFIKMTNDGAVSINSTTVQLGEVTSTLLALINSTAQNLYNTHTHTVSGAVTLPPDAPFQWGPGTLTTNTKAN